MGLRRRSFGPSRCRWRSEISCGKLAQIAYLLKIIYTGDAWKWNQHVSCADNNLRRSVTCCGHARLQEMSGLSSREEHKNAVMKLVIFFLFFKHVQSKLSKVELERWVVTAWAIWNARNKYYFKKTQYHLKQILDSVGGLFEEYQRLVDTQRVA